MYGNTLRIPYTSQDFPIGSIADWGDLQTQWSDLLWAALTVGRPNRSYFFAHSDASFYEGLFRLSLVKMALEKCPVSGLLQRTDTFRSLDLTEKGAISYFLGMAVCKLFADKYLNTPWLLHFDVFRDQLYPGLLDGRSRPDLIGENDKGEWHAFECKGRSSVPSEQEKWKAKAQAQRLVRVNSTNCSLHVGAISYFRQDTLEFHWRDPAPEDTEMLEPIEVILPKDAWLYYYSPALSLATNERSEALENAYIRIEIHETIRKLLQARKWSEARSMARELGPEFKDRGFHADGLKVVAGESWLREHEAKIIDL